ncbi:hypothetical protein [Undibacterium sp. SXout20W]|uniref:hypothetical protein n=1 Tax=Undibacterium sp. SXout20W TaxID=3413051 RepID=UPI003BF01A8B
MVQAIDSSTLASTSASSATTSVTTDSAASAGELQAQLAQYQRQLSDCVNCSSANTPEGKQQISEISSKISAIKQTIQASQANALKQVATPKAVNATHHAADYQAISRDSANQGSNESSPLQNQVSTDAVRPPVAANLTVGVNVNLYS